MAVQSKVREICGAMRMHGLRRGYVASTLAKTAVYAAYRSHGIPLALSEFAGTNAKERKSIARCYNRLCRKLDLKVSRVESKDYLQYLAAKRKFPKEALALADKILEAARENGIAGGANPIGIAAAALYISSTIIGHRITQTEVGKAAGISSVTLRSDCRVMQKLILQKTKNRRVGQEEKEGSVNS
jgi:transcription initiation factor TFIIB